MNKELQQIRSALMVFSSNVDALANRPASNELLAQLQEIQANELQAAMSAFQRLQRVYQR